MKNIQIRWKVKVEHENVFLDEGDHYFKFFQTSFFTQLFEQMKQNINSEPIC
jgi:hypothetical protein